MITAVWISVFLIGAYTLYCLYRYGIPESLSQTYYMIEWKPAWTLAIFVSAFLSLPAAMEQTPSEIKLIPFLGIFGLLLVGAAPRVRDYERVIHISGAIMTGIFSQLWVALYGDPWLFVGWVIPVLIGVACLKGPWSEIMERLDRWCFVFWCELTCYLTFYVSLLK